MAVERVHLFFVGTAGSGKTALTHAFHEWLAERGLDSVVVNLDPGVELLPYTPDIDVREWVSVNEVMERYGIGPNGAQILSADLMATRFKELLDVLDEFKTQYVLIDTPGQIELFAYRQASKVVLEALGEDRSLIAFLFDPALAGTPSGFVSLSLLSASIEFRFSTPFINILAKSDLLEEEDVERAVSWSIDYNRLYEELLNVRRGMRDEFTLEFLKCLQDAKTMSKLVPVSSKTYFGMEDVYNALQQTFFAGEDTLQD